MVLADDNINATSKFKIIASFAIGIYHDSEKIERSIYGFFDFLVDVGGFAGAVIIVGLLSSIYLTQSQAKCMLVDHYLRIKSDEDNDHRDV